MSGFVYYDRTSCPVCGTHDGRCRSPRNNPEMVLCMTGAGYDAAVAGYRYVGDTKGGEWGQYVPDDGQAERNREEWERRKAERERRQEEARQKELQDLSAALPIDERSAQNRLWQGQLSLDPDHYENLKARGLSDRQIKLGGFKTVEPGQVLSRSVSPRLAGIDRTGRKTWVPGRGILCPATNAKGQLLGFQIRLDDGGKGGKYRWLKSSTIAVSKLPHGEMPITVVRPEGRGFKTIGLCEGLLKPYIAANLSQDTAFIGASGGSFTSTPQQLREAILALLEENPHAEIIFYPDAGAIANKAVNRKDEKTVALLREWGYLPRVAYWGQGLDHSALDIDELLAAGRGGEVKFISPEDYQKQGGKELRRRKSKEAYANLTRLTYPVSVELNQKFLDGGANLIEWGKLNFVSSACKTGKTTLLGEVVGRHRTEFPEAKVYAIGYRNALLRQTCQRTGLTHIEDCQTKEEGSGKGFKPNPEVINGTREIALCLDSLPRLELEKIQPGSLVILDEVDAIVQHAIEGGTLGDQQEQILLSWKAFLNRVLELGGTILGMEDDLTDTPIDFLREITGNRYPTRLIRNTYQASKWDVTIGSGSIHGLLARAVELVKAGEKIAIGFAGQERGELSHTVLEESGGVNIVRCDAATTEAGTGTMKDMHDLMQMPDEWIEAYAPDAFLFSPVIESGVSFWTNHFDRLLFFATSHETRKQIQMLERIRPDIPREIFVSDFFPNQGGFDPERILKDLQRSARQTARVAGLNPEKLDALESPTEESNLFNRYAARFQARKNAANSQMKGNLIDELRRRGHNVVETRWEKDDRIKELYKAAKEAKGQKDANDWHDAPGELPLLEAKETLKSPSATRKDRFDAKKSLLKADYPGLNLTRDFLLEMVVRNRREGLKYSELEWVCENPKIAAILDRKAMESAIDKPLLLYRRLTHRRLKGDLIRSLDGFLETLRSGRELRPSDSDVGGWAKILCDRRQEVYRVLGLTAHSAIKPIRLLSYVADRLGYDFKAVKREGSRGDRQRVYVAVERNPQHRAAIKEALDRRYDSLVEDDAAAIAQTLHAAGDSGSVSAKNNTHSTTNDFVDTNLIDSVKALQSGDSSPSSEPSLALPKRIREVVEVANRDSKSGRLTLPRFRRIICHLSRGEKEQFWAAIDPETRERITAIAS